MSGDRGDRHLEDEAAERPAVGDGVAAAADESGDGERDARDRDAATAPGGTPGAGDETLVPGAIASDAATFAGTGAPCSDGATIASGGGGPGAAAPWSRPGLPARIGHYRIVRVLAQGGMGTVFEAEQDQPKRTVALKVIKAGLASPSALRRFEYESQVLARLRHPGIAQVYEAGTHDDGEGGVPYFVMEYVAEARILSEYAETHRLDTGTRLELFIKICDAVHHGHQKGVIHRDLKPGNILVDPSGQPKIIDFGIARATDVDMAAATMQTQVGELVGTVQYMSPEQVEADPNDLDTRSDVYALGVVLYELLTGQLPYDVSSVPIFEATRLIREKPPTPLAPIRSELRGDIETIVLKALEKERDRRYQSATEFAADIRRYLDHEPILARPASLVYQFRKFAKRNKAIVGGAVAVLLTLVVGFVGTTWGMVEARRNARTANAITGYFQRMFTSLDAIDGVGPDLRVSAMLDRSTADIGLENEPAVLASIQWSVGNGYRALTMWDKAEAQLRLALETRRRILKPPDPALAQAIFDYAAVLYSLRRFDEAERLFREALDMRAAVHGDLHEEIANARNYLAATIDAQGRTEEAETLYRDALAMRRTLAERACAAQGGASSEACAAARDRVARATNNLAFGLMRQGRLAEAEELFRAALVIVRALRGQNDVLVAGAMNNLARCVASQGLATIAAGRDDDANRRRLDEAASMLENALEMKIEGYGPDHTSTAITHYHFADLLQARGRLEQAESHAREALRIRRLRFDPPHREIDRSLDLLGGIQATRREWDAAAETLEALVELRRMAHPDGDTSVTEAEERLAAVREAMR